MGSERGQWLWEEEEHLPKQDKYRSCGKYNQRAGADQSRRQLNICFPSPSPGAIRQKLPVYKKYAGR